MSQSFMGEEIATQPDCWRRVAGMAAGLGDRLGAPGSRVAVVGCGTSRFMSESYAVLRERAGLGETDSFPASEFPTGRAYDQVVAITRSGTTTEVLDLMASLKGKLPTVAITAVPAEIAPVVDDVIDLSFTDERSVVQTRFATSTLALLRAHLGEDLTVPIQQAAGALTEPIPAEVRGAAEFTFVGTGWAVGIANEASLKLREASRVWTESYPAWEYRHGPISIAEPGRVTWMFGTPPPGLVEDVRRTGVILVNDDLDPLADLVRVQRLADLLAADRGLDPDTPRGLTRSIVLN